MAIPKNQTILEQFVGYSDNKDIFYITSNPSRTQFALYRGNNESTAVKVKTSTNIGVLIEFVEGK